MLVLFTLAGCVVFGIGYLFGGIDTIVTMREAQRIAIEAPQDPRP